MSTKVYFNVITRRIIVVEDYIKVSEVISEMDYNFNSTTDGADIVETEIVDYEVTDSK